MLLALDVGNTSITLGMFRGKRLFSRGRIPTHRPGGAAAYRSAIRRFLRRSSVPAGAVGGVILSSVVPRATVSLKQVLKSVLKLKPYVVGENIQAPVINRYGVPSQVGQDRLVNAAAACFLYKGPAIVVDFGTAITIDLVTRRREYRGGMIVPGMEIALEALSSRAALLPKIKLERPREDLGRDTVSSMRSGIFYGYGSLCDGIVRLLMKKYAPKAKVIATGGHCRLIAPFCRTIRIVNPDLTLKGLEITHRVKIHPSTGSG